jgi:hypothetical protein
MAMLAIQWLRIYQTSRADGLAHHQRLRRGRRPLQLLQLGLHDGGAVILHCHLGCHLSEFAI